MISQIACPVCAKFAEKIDVIEASAPVTFKIHHSVSTINPADWDHLLDCKLIFLRREYLLAFERSHQDVMACRYIVMYQKDIAVGLVFSHILLVDQPFLQFAENVSTDASSCVKVRSKVEHWVQDHLINQYQFGVLVVGNLFLTGEHAFVFHPHTGANKFYTTLEKAINKIIADYRFPNGKTISMVLIKDFAPDKKGIVDLFLNENFHQIQSEPDMVLDIWDNWHSFDDYLKAMSSKYRVRAKRVMKKGKPLTRTPLSYEQIKDHQAIIHLLYQSIARESDFNLGYLEPTYFANLKKEMGDSFQVTLYTLNDRPVGFTSCFITHEGLDAHYVGYVTDLNRQYAIYNNMLYDLIHIAIDHKCKQLSFARTATEIKSTVGAKPQDLYLYFRHENKVMNKILSRYAKNFVKADYVLRNPLKEK